MGRVPNNKGLNIALWVVQVLLAVAFAGAGFLKLTAPIADLAAKMAWINPSNPGLVRFIGAVEILGAIGLIVPAATRIKPVLTALAALGLTIVMVLAVGTHVMMNDIPGAVPSIVLGALSAFVAWGRGRKAPILPR